MEKICNIFLNKSSLWFRPKPKKLIDNNFQYIFKSNPSLSKVKMLIDTVKKIIERDESEEDKIVNEKKYLNFLTLDKDVDWSENHFCFYFFKNYTISTNFESSQHVTFHSTNDLLYYLETFEYLHERHFKFDTLNFLINEMLDFYMNNNVSSCPINYFTEFNGDIFSILVTDPSRLKDLNINEYVLNSINV